MSEDDNFNTDEMLKILFFDKEMVDGKMLSKFFVNAIILSFMKIFALENCDHLLENEDLIDLTLHCLEHSLEITN